ncbi:hypothetical protein ACH61_01704 [Rathayibacter tanaceti]|uniref:Uncharacterized protein n=1 Tax=Rathayibacter tanaceti TaxID=1671680 RepID=A0A162J2A2_9MICO|nr:hypothetical protein [Rathayibacter tanaceti]KZX21157.1 hypothetical protein ACH61_01704 [Rathayibacter tanaceti]
MRDAPRSPGGGEQGGPAAGIVGDEVEVVDAEVRAQILEVVGGRGCGAGGHRLRAAPAPGVQHEDAAGARHRVEAAEVRGVPIGFAGHDDEGAAGAVLVDVQEGAVARPVPHAVPLPSPLAA